MKVKIQNIKTYGMQQKQQIFMTKNSHLSGYRRNMPQHNNTLHSASEINSNTLRIKADEMIYQRFI